MSCLAGRRPDHHRGQSLARPPRRRLDRGRSRRVAAALLATLAMGPAAWGQSFVQRVVSEDACLEARRFEHTDDSPAAQHARRACRLQQFEARLHDERQEQVVAQVEQRNARVQKWLDHAIGARGPPAVAGGVHGHRARAVRAGALLHGAAAAGGLRPDRLAERRLTETRN